MNKKAIKRIIPKIIRHDFLRKLIAFSFALLVYYLVQIKIGEEETIVGKVTLQLPEKYIAINELPQVKIRVQASKRKLAQLQAKDVSIIKTFAEIRYRHGEPYILNLRTRDVNTPVGIKVLSIEPNKLKVELDKKMSKKVRIKAKFTNKSSLREGYTVNENSVSFTPETVTVTGPGSIIESLESVKTEPILISRETMEDFEKHNLKIEMTGKNINLFPSRVIAHVKVKKILATKSFKFIPVKILNSHDPHSLTAKLTSQSYIRVTVTGHKNILNLLQSEQIQAYIDLSNYKTPGEYNIKVNCYAPEKIKIKHVFPKNIKVKLIKK